MTQHPELVFKKGVKPKTALAIKKLWLDIVKHKWLYAIVLPIALAVGCIYAFSVPETYTCTVKLSPELSNAARDNIIMRLLAKQIKIGVGGTEDAITPILYPQLMNSIEYRLSLLNVKIKRPNDEKEITYYEHLVFEQKQAWWTELKQSTMSWVKNGFSLKKEIEAPRTIGEVDPFRLNDFQDTMVSIVAALVKCEVDPQSLTVMITVVDQDPYVCAVMADSVQAKLQQFVTEYRTSKARIDYDYYDKITAQAKKKYDDAKNKYATFADSNRDTHSETVKGKIKDLEANAYLQYQIYEKASERKISASIKIQEEKPVFAVLTPATVPIERTTPMRTQMCVTFLLFVVLLTSIWVFHKEGDLKLFLIGWP